MKVKRHFVWNGSLLRAVVVALACAMSEKATASAEAGVAGIPVDASLCERRAFVVAGTDGVGITSLDEVTWIPIGTPWARGSTGPLLNPLLKNHFLTHDKFGKQTRQPSYPCTTKKTPGLPA
jgi:hypothetical protein